MSKLRNYLIAILFITLLVFLIYMFFSYAKVELFKKKASLENEILRLKSEYSFFKYRIDSVNDGISFTFYILGMGGEILTNGILTIEGRDIFVESKVIILNPTNSLVFPVRIFSDIVSADKGIELKSFYLSDKEFNYTDNNEMNRFFNAVLSFYIFGEGNIDRYKRFIKSEIDVVLHSGIPVKEGEVYECVLHPEGQLELKRSDL